VAASLGATKAVAYDLTAACSGFLFATITASQFLHTGTFKNAIVVGADALSRSVTTTSR
jgi:3-oxoacyl-[acyl-carrier-protein] synthase-3